MKVRKAVFPAAGLGTRFLPATKAQPKEMLPLVDKPIIQYVIEEAASAGLTNIIIVTGRGKNAIEDHFDVSYELEKLLEERKKFDLLEQVRAITSMITVCYVRQGETLGLGHAVLMAKELVGDEPFAVMLGDVSSHGFGAALVMALVLSAAGIHVETIGSPEATLDALLNSVGDELRSAEMYFTVFYGVLDRRAATLRYASAGHPHAFRIPRVGDPERLLATSPPVGLAVQGVSEARQIAWDVEGDLLCLWTDGLVDATNEAGERYGDARLIEALSCRRGLPVEEILAGALAEADAWTRTAADDRTLLVMRL